MKRFAKSENIYAFLCPYFSEQPPYLENEHVLSWADTEGEAWDLYYEAANI